MSYRIIYIAALCVCVGTVTQFAQAFDFGNITRAVKDLDKVVDVGKRVIASTTELSVEQEIALGDDLTARLLGAMPPLKDPAVQTFVNRLGRWLSLHTARPELPWRFIVVDTESLGAFATPGGNVVISAGLIRIMRDENELAGVLAHEIMHVVDKHHIKAIMQRARVSLARDVATDLVGDYVAGNPLVADAVLNAGMDLYASGLDHADEIAADREGMILAARAGYDPLGLLLVLTTLDSIDAVEPRGSLMRSTHPPPASRIEQLAQAAERLNADQPSTLVDTNRFTRMQASLF